ncbi:MAG: TauD/TfdA family dioxygenase [Thiohalomonadaceae bacterium]
MNAQLPQDSPFSLDNDDAYRRWRDAKLENYPTRLEELVVEVNEPRILTQSEHAALQQRLQKTNMVIYVAATGDDPDKAILHKLGAQLGLSNLDSNYLADDDGLSSLTINPEGEHARYIPYTNRAINWHTDGYYNTAEKQIRGLMLHCVHPAAEGGDNQLLDHEIAYIWLRDENPDFIGALMQDDVMTIPPGTSSEGGTRMASTGPVFSWHADSNSLHMRYTARKRNIEWLQDEASRAAVAHLEKLLDDARRPYYFRGRLESGMGLISNNVLHDRSGFRDDPATSQRLLYRARYFDRVAAT